MSNVTIYEPNFTQIPNSVISIMPNLSEAEFKVIMAICRKTFGYHKSKDRISLSQLEELTGMSRSSVTKAIHGEQLKRIVRVIKTPKGNVYEPVITPNTANESGSKSELPEEKTPNTANETSTKSEPVGEQLVQNLNQTSIKSELPAGSKSEHTKENSTKENKQKKDYTRVNGVPVPELLQNKEFIDGYNLYCRYLKENYNRWPTSTTTEVDLRKLLQLKKDGNDPVEVIAQTIQTRNKVFFAIRNFEKKDKPDSELTEGEWRRKNGLRAHTKIHYN